MSPLERYKYYGERPYRLSIHILIICISSYLSFLIRNSYANSYAPQRVAFYYQFMADDQKTYNDWTWEYDKYLAIYNITSLQEKISDGREKYMSLNDPTSNMLLGYLNNTDCSQPGVSLFPVVKVEYNLGKELDD